MNDLRKQFISKDFIINSNVVKCISKLNISLNEFLLLLYFINITCNLDMDDIKDKTGLSDEDIFKAFNNLVNNKYIDMSVKNDGGSVIETINLDSFYDKLVLDCSDNKNTNDIFGIFEKELGRVLSSYEYEILNRWISEGISEDVILGALKEAILSNVTNFKYIDKIVYSWNKKKINVKEKQSSKYNELDDYNWLVDE